MEAALFFPSGVQANQTAMWLLTEKGTEVAVEADAHVVHYEKAALAAISGVQIRPVPTPDGLLTGALLREAWRATPHLPRISAVVAENTHNAGGGKVMPPPVWDGVVAEAREWGVPVHLDGARVWHAAVALDVPVSRLTRGATTVMVSLSKGLGCPVGSCLAASRDLVQAAREVRRRLGGAMRQTGILAAAGLYALDHHLPHLAYDHAHATLLADRLADHPRIELVPPETNIVMIDLPASAPPADEAVRRLAAAGVQLVAFGPARLRAVTHLDVTREDVERAAEVIARVLA
jgi:threonine aldolase